MNKKNIPFSFIFDLLFPLDIIIKPMFGMHAIYLESKILLILRKKDKTPDKNGIWLAIKKENQFSLIKEVKTIQPLKLDQKKETTDTEWLLIAENDEYFENTVSRICELIKNGDIRIGKEPKIKRAKAPTK